MPIINKYESVHCIVRSRAGIQFQALVNKALKLLAADKTGIFLKVSRLSSFLLALVPLSYVVHPSSIPEY